MKIEVTPLRLKTAHPFTIARETKTDTDTFVVSLSDGDHTGYGEASPQAYYGETALTVRGAVHTAGNLLKGTPDELIEALVQPDSALRRALDIHPSVRAAIDMALWDLKGKMEGKPVYEYFNANPSNTPQTSFTIGFDTIEVVDRKLEDAAEFRILKLKVGLIGDMELLDHVITRTGKKVRVDANEGWDVEMAIQKTQELYERGVEFVEQPIHHDDEDGLRELKRVSPLPVILDESIEGPEDIPRRHDQGHGINIKLMKCGGITPAFQMIQLARDLGLQVMLGCMLESSLGITAAAHLSPLVNYADLDGNLLLAEDPFRGVRTMEGKLVLPEAPGLGVEWVDR